MALKLPPTQDAILAKKDLDWYFRLPKNISHHPGGDWHAASWGDYMSPILQEIAGLIKVIMQNYPLSLSRRLHVRHWGDVPSDSHELFSKAPSSPSGFSKDKKVPAVVSNRSKKPPLYVPGSIN